MPPKPWLRSSADPQFSSGGSEPPREERGRGWGRGNVTRGTESGRGARVALAAPPRGTGTRRPDSLLTALRRPTPTPRETAETPRTALPGEAGGEGGGEPRAGQPTRGLCPQRPGRARRSRPRLSVPLCKRGERPGPAQGLEDRERWRAHSGHLWRPPRQPPALPHGAGLRAGRRAPTVSAQTCGCTDDCSPNSF